MNILLRSPLITALLAVAASAALVACDKPGDQTVGQQVDSAIAGAKVDAEKAKADGREIAQDTKNAASEAADNVTQAASDATITTKINAALATDDKLSAMRIDVDTSQGMVTLSGTAPDDMSKERATTLSAAVEGVSNVTNRLMVTRQN